MLRLDFGMLFSWHLSLAKGLRYVRLLSDAGLFLEKVQTIVFHPATKEVSAGKGSHLFREIPKNLK
jgi:hypothetical protein